MTGGNGRSSSGVIMDRAIDLVLEGRSPFPEEAVFVDAETPAVDIAIEGYGQDGTAVVVVWPDLTTRILEPGWRPGRDPLPEPVSLD